ncbi:MAG: hypothetical protein IKU48_05990 [Clostridia bacterium]|nr:hypothetical protein [Clostridia bacterium]
MKKIFIILIPAVIFCILLYLYNIDYWVCIFSNHSTTSNSSPTLYPATNIVEPNNLEPSNDVEVIEETHFYKLTCENNEYYCYFYDSERNIVKNEGPLIKCPKVTFVNENYIKLTVQAGTGLSTQYGYYYDTQQAKFSEVFYWILAESNNQVAYAMADKVVIQDIFDKNNYYKEISIFEYPLAIAIEPIVKAEFIENHSVLITYLTGNNFEEITELFEL